MTRSPLAALAATVLLLGLATAPASAGQRTIHDARRDVVKQSDDTAQAPAREHLDADVTTFVTTFTDRRLVLRTRVRQLPRNYWAMLWRIRTVDDPGTATDYRLSLLKTPQVRLTLTVGDTTVPCAGLRKQVERRAGRVTVRVPLGCLGRPGAVRTGAAAAATERGFARIYADDAQRRGRFDADHLALGRTVKRG